MKLTKDQKKLTERIQSTDPQEIYRAWKELSQDSELLIYCYRNQLLANVPLIVNCSSVERFEVDYLGYEGYKTDTQGITVKNDFKYFLREKDSKVERQRENFSKNLKKFKVVLGKVSNKKDCPEAAKKAIEAILKGH